MVVPFESKDNDMYYVLYLGRDLDATKAVSSKEEFIKVFYDITGRTDVEFGDLIWASTFQ